MIKENMFSHLKIICPFQLVFVHFLDLSLSGVLYYQLLNFIMCLFVLFQVNQAVVTAREAVKCGKCVVIGLQSTGEARTLDQLERDDGELSDFVSTAK